MATSSRPTTSSSASHGSAKVVLPAGGARPGAKPLPAEPDEEVDPPVEPAEPADALSADDAKALLRGGHRLKKVGDEDENWIAYTRQRGDLAMARPVTEENEEELLKEQLVLID